MEYQYKVVKEEIAFGVDMLQCAFFPVGESLVQSRKRSGSLGRLGPFV